MSEVNKNAINYHSYDAYQDENLISQVARVVCTLLPKGLLVAGYNEHGDLQMVRYGDYSNAVAPWMLDFYEHRFLGEPLLQQPEKVIAFFICSDKYLLVPEELYEEHAAARWLRQIFFIEGNEMISAYPLEDDQVRYLYAWPAAVKSLIGRYFPDAKILPFAAYQFYKPYRTGHHLQCAITPESVYATLYHNRALQWHQVFAFTNGEDIAYHIHLLFKQWKVKAADADLNYSGIYRGMNPVLNEMSQYFESMHDVEAAISSGHQWVHTIKLLQQLYSCAL